MYAMHEIFIIFACVCILPKTFQFDGIRLVSFILPLFHVHWKILAYAPSIMPNIWSINELFHQNQLLNYIFSTT
jgi:hypothetical protein